MVLISALLYNYEYVMRNNSENDLLFTKLHSQDNTISVQ